LKEQFHRLHIDENTKIFDHLSIFNDIISE